MIFGEISTAEAEGAILAHSLRVGNDRFRKGRRLSGEDVARMADAGINRVTVAKPGAGDLGEDRAAELLAEALGSDGISVSAPFTGRSNLHAETAGVLRISGDAVARFNAVDEAITLATLSDFARVRTGQMIATVKIIPYAAAGADVEAAKAEIRGPVIRLHPFLPLRTKLILTQTPGMKASLLDKAEKAVSDRLTDLGCPPPETVLVPHTEDAVANALSGKPADLTLIFGGSATSDRRDVCPAGLVAAGGSLTRFGMPVDPGNLLFLGNLGDRPVVGLPGCARSPALNGADWVLERLVAGLPVTSEDIANMGVGGLLKEIPVRPQPRQAARASLRPRIEVILLAAGASRRMRGRDKLLEPVGGVSLLRHAAERMIASKADGVRVVLPADATHRHAALEGLDLDVVEASDAHLGMAASLKAGLRARNPATEAVIVALADMPEVEADHVNRLIAAYDPEEGRSIARAVSEAGSPGHPVLFDQRFFEALEALSGDEGARRIIKDAADFVADVPTMGDGAVVDLDTPEAWAEWRARAV